MSSGDKDTRLGMKEAAALKAKALEDRVALAKRALQRDPTLKMGELSARYGWSKAIRTAVERALNGEKQSAGATT